MWLYYINIVDYYVNTIYDMQNEKEYLNLYKKFVHNHDFEIVFWKKWRCIFGIGNFR